MTRNLLFLLTILVVFSSTKFVKDEQEVPLERVQKISFEFNDLARSSNKRSLFERNQFNLRFEAYGKKFQFEMGETPQSLFHSSSRIKIYAGEELIEEREPAKIRLFSSVSNGTQSLIRFSLFPNGEWAASLFQDGEGYVIEPLSFLPDHQQKKFVGEERVIYRQSDMPINVNRLCGLEVDEEKDLHRESSKAAPENEHSKKQTNFPTRWQNCYQTPSTERKLVIGLAADVGFFRKMGTTGAVELYLANLFALTNTIYYYQVGLWLEIGEFVIQTTTGGPTWNEANGNCNDISTKLTNFRNWRRNEKPARPEGIWHVFTDCYPPPGTVGVAYLNVLCNLNFGVGVNSYIGTETWVVFAHELGHNAGAGHTFFPQGATGGIMDYGDWTLNGIYQFNTQYSKDEVCTAVNSAIGLTDSCIYPYAAVCGNGKIEIGEECDDTSPCCIQPNQPGQCTLVPRAQCSGGECCQSDCTISPTTTTCSFGYCGFSDCSIPIGKLQTNAEFCQVSSDAPCNEQVSVNGGACSTSNRYRISNGAICGPTSGYTCSSGTCVCTPDPVCSPFECGVKTDGCDGTKTCPGCLPEFICVNGFCECEPLTTCEAEGLSCGDLDNGCGIISCGNCTAESSSSGPSGAVIGVVSTLAFLFVVGGVAAAFFVMRRRNQFKPSPAIAMGAPKNTPTVPPATPPTNNRPAAPLPTPPVNRPPPSHSYPSQNPYPNNLPPTPQRTAPSYYAPSQQTFPVQSRPPVLPSRPQPSAPPQTISYGQPSQRFPQGNPVPPQRPPVPPRR